MDHSCRLCGRVRANEKFSGRGHRDHVCRDCEQKPRAWRDRTERLDELYGLLGQSSISGRNRERHFNRNAVSAFSPRVATQELPWGIVQRIMNPERVASIASRESPSTVPPRMVDGMPPLEGCRES
jgi:hypothetical protein